MKSGISKIFEGLLKNIVENVTSLFLKLLNIFELCQKLVRVRN